MASSFLEMGTLGLVSPFLQQFIQESGSHKIPLQKLAECVKGIYSQIN